MANIRREYGSIMRTGLDRLNTYLTGLDTNQWSMGNINKAWRSLILINRERSGNVKDPYLSESTDPAKSGNLTKNKTTREEDINGGVRIYHDDGRIAVLAGNNPDMVSSIESEALAAIDKGKRLLNAKTQNRVIIYNISSTPYQYIELQVRPASLDFKGETTWASIKSMGRNTPMYHYTGAEDTLQFNTSWFRTDPNHPDEVVNKCRLLEAWSKSDGYNAAPPILMIQWGDDQADSLFKDHKYILISATYTLKNFSDTTRTWDSGKKTLSNSLINNKLYPTSATQELIFKRVSSNNLGYEDIISTDKLSRTRGIKNI